LPEALAVILRQCENTNVEPIVCGDSARLTNITDDGRCVVTFETPQGSYENVRLGLRGRHQISNATVAVALAESLRARDFAITNEAIVSGLENASHPGRLELWNGEPRILFDGAHNPAAAQALREYLDEFVRSPITMIFGGMKDKRLNEMAALLLPKADDLILTELDNPRAASLEALRDALPRELDCAKLHQANSIQEALEIAGEITPPNGLVCITGSLYLVGAAQEALAISRSRDRQ
jgi:dihydrofolate synthase/folylpolyglutamate synthase